MRFAEPRKSSNATSASAVGAAPAASVRAVRASEYGQIQGNILSGYQLPHGAFLLVRVDDAARGRDWLRELVDRGRVTTASDQKQWPTEAWNVAVTFPGLRVLGVPERLLKPFPEDFRDGMQARAKRLGDSGRNDPRHWEVGLREPDRGHVMLMLRANEAYERDRLVREARRGLRRRRLRVVYDDVCDPLPAPPGDQDRCGTDTREHFGFADGCSQPAIEGTSATGRDPDKPLKAGEFLLGYRDEEGGISGGARFFRNGSFMVFRKLEQRVAAFRRAVADNVSERLTKEEVEAKIVGRATDGRPLVPVEGSGEAHDRAALNEFSYASPSGARRPTDRRAQAGDPYGVHCPLGAHIRRTFPRDALVAGEDMTRRHRLLRRGMPYGSALPDGALPEDHDDRGRGLLFICFNASIARQFETVQGWCLDGNLFDLPHESDFLLAPYEEATMTVQMEGSESPCVLTRREQLVVTRGGGYFFYPSLDALTAIANQDYLDQEDPLPS